MTENSDETINLSILDFKRITEQGTIKNHSTINLSILDFKQENQKIVMLSEFL